VWVGAVFAALGSEGGYHVSFPDFPTIRVEGETLEHTRVRAEYALFFHIRRLVAESEAIPEPSGLEVIMAYSKP
jgi:predicted RNase H-like HicB family nuclease